MENVKIRAVTPSDAPRLLEIYAYYVKNTAISFEYDVPSLEEFTRRIEATLQKYPYLCAECNGDIMGYAYAGAFHPRAAYQWGAELSVYIDRNAQKCGIGKQLYAQLEHALKAMGLLTLYACVAVPDADDEFLTHNSVDFHKHLGFTEVGTFRNSGYKFGRWYNMLWLEKCISFHTAPQRPITPYPVLRKQKCT